MNTEKLLFNSIAKQYILFYLNCMHSVGEFRQLVLNRFFLLSPSSKKTINVVLRYKVVKLKRNFEFN